MKCPNPDCKGELERVPTTGDYLVGGTEDYFVEVTHRKDGKIDRRRYILLECPDCGLTVLHRKR